MGQIVVEPQLWLKAGKSPAALVVGLALEYEEVRQLLVKRVYVCQTQLLYAVSLGAARRGDVLSGRVAQCRSDIVGAAQQLYSVFRTYLYGIVSHGRLVVVLGMGAESVGGAIIGKGCLEQQPVFVVQCVLGIGISVKGFHLVLAVYHVCALVEIVYVLVGLTSVGGVRQGHVESQFLVGKPCRLESLALLPYRYVGIVGHGLGRDNAAVCGKIVAV